MALNERQMLIVERVVEKGHISSGEAADIFSFSRQAALKELKKLESLGVLKLKGKGRSAQFEMV